MAELSIAGTLYSGIERRKHEADTSYSSNEEAENVWRNTSTAPCSFIAKRLIKHRDSFTV